jgi:hypothetical protein
VFAATAVACGGSALDGIDPGSTIKPDPLAVGTWDLVRARSDTGSTLPFACETAQDRTSWPCIGSAITDTIMAGVVVLDSPGLYGVAITHRVRLAGTTQVIDRIVDESNIENASGARTGSWGRSGMRIVFYPAAVASTTRYGDLTDTSFVHGLTAFSIGGARFVLR